ncbi:MAG: type I secretion system permease/ATPase, partial [Gammaproteobacteria bacterium]|nr:type I secretion system permease/ATPase [Gammaproteobacteria bacterium]
MRNDLHEAVDDLSGAFFALAGFSAAINILMLAAPLYMLQVFDRVLTSQSIDTLVLLTLIVALSFVALGCLEGVRSLALTRLSAWFDQRLAQRVLQAGIVEKLGGTPGATAQGLRDLATVRSFIGGPAMFPIMDAPWIPLFIAVLFLLHPLLGWMALAGAVALFTLALVNEFATRALLQRAGAAQIKAMGEAEAAVRNADVIEAMGMFDALAARWGKRQAEALALQSRAGARSGVLSATSKFTRLLLQSGMLGVGAWLVIQQQLSPGGMVAGTILLGRAMAPVDQAMNSWKALIAARGAYQRLADCIADTAGRTGSMSLPKPSGRVSCEGVTYRHGETGEPTLRNVSFELESGTVLGIVGPSAAGKTTLARLLVGNLAPRLGQVRLDGVDVSRWVAADRGRHVGYLPQDIELFSGTVAENIARLEEPDAELVLEAARLAGVHELVLRLPHGYDTEIGEGGAALSAGQRQRIGLARALYGGPSLLVLDEPNSNLDKAGLDALLNAFDVLRTRGKTVIVIAHQPNVIRHVDALLVL